MTQTSDLKSLLDLVDKVFGIDRVLADTGRDVVETYYAQSGPAYERIHSDQGCMHLALNFDGVFNPVGLRVQPKAIIKELTELHGKSVLELGCGKGFNSLFIADAMPHVQCMGTDLLTPHLEKAREFASSRGATNITFEQASYEPVPDRYRGYDVVFGVETLCYAKDLDAVAGSIAAALRPGGRFVMFDVHAGSERRGLPKDMDIATRLYETSMAVTTGFIRARAWEAALERAGLQVEPTRNMTKHVQPGLLRLQGLALKTLDDWKTRLAIKALPPYLARNAISALLGPTVFRLPDGGHGGALMYQKIMATKPAD